MGSFDSLNLSKISDCRSFSDLKTVTGTQPKNFEVSQTTVSLSAERQPSVRPAIYTALLDRLAVVNRHMIVWIEWASSVP